MHYVRGLCNFLSPVSLQQKFEATDRPVLQLCVTGQFYLASKGKYILKAWGRADPKDLVRREVPPTSGSILAHFKKINYFNWRLITLQYCSGFCHTLTWISHEWTCVPHPERPFHLPSIPSLRVIPVHWPWASCLMHQTWTGDLFHIC